MVNNTYNLEEMSSFFEKRVNSYDEHMLNEVEGCKEAYVKMAKLIPDSTKTLLDLGCGTGLELDEIFKRLPNLKVTGVDLTMAMLNKLKEKHRDKDVTLIEGDYFKVNFNDNHYDVAVSFQSLHHFKKDVKTKLYQKIYRCLKNDGYYIESDYMAPNQEYEDFYFSEYDRLQKESDVTGNYYHYDTPCTVDNQIAMLQAAGFTAIQKVFQYNTTVILIAKKHCNCLKNV